MQFAMFLGPVCSKIGKLKVIFSCSRKFLPQIANLSKVCEIPAVSLSTASKNFGLGKDSVVKISDNMQSYVSLQF